MAEVYCVPLKSTSPFPSVSNMSITLCTSGFCCSSGSDMNSSTLSEPELSRSSFLNLFPSLLISSASTGQRQRKRREKNRINVMFTFILQTFVLCKAQVKLLEIMHPDFLVFYADLVKKKEKESCTVSCSSVRFLLFRDRHIHYGSKYFWVTSWLLPTPAWTVVIHFSGSKLGQGQH